MRAHHRSRLQVDVLLLIMGVLVANRWLYSARDVSVELGWLLLGAGVSPTLWRGAREAVCVALWWKRIRRVLAVLATAYGGGAIGASLVEREVVFPLHGALCALPLGLVLGVHESGSGMYILDYGAGVMRWAATGDKFSIVAATALLCVGIFALGWRAREVLAVCLAVGLAGVASAMFVTLWILSRESPSRQGPWELTAAYSWWPIAACVMWVGGRCLWVRDGEGESEA